MPQYTFKAFPYQGTPEKVEITAKNYDAALNKLYARPWVKAANLLNTAR